MVNSFRKIAQSVTNTSSSVTGTTNTNFNSLYQSALASAQATSDSVDYTASTDSSSSTTSAATWIGVGLSALSMAPSLIAMVKSLSSSSNSTASTGNPVQDVDNALKANDKKALVSATTAAFEAANSIDVKIAQKTTEINNLNSVVKKAETDNNSSYNEIVKDCVSNIQAQDETVKNETAFIDNTNKVLDNLKEGKINNAKELETAGENLDEARIQKEKSAGEVKEKEDIATRTEEQKAEYEANQNAMIKEYSTVNKSLTSANAQISKLTPQISELNNSLNSIPGQISAKKSAIKNDEALLKKGSTDTNLSSRVSTLKGEITQLEETEKSQKAQLKDLESKQKAAEKQKETAEKRLAELDKEIKVGDLTIADLKASVATAEANKAAAQESLDKSVETVEGYIDVQKTKKAYAETLNKGITDESQKVSAANVNLKDALTYKQEGYEVKADATKSKETVEKQIASLKKEIEGDKQTTGLMKQRDSYYAAYKKGMAQLDSGYTAKDLTSPDYTKEGSVEDGISSITGKKKETTTATAQADKKEDVNPTDFSTAQDELKAKAGQLGYLGDLTGVTSLEKKGDNFEITKNGKKLTVDNKGNEVTA